MSKFDTLSHKDKLNFLIIFIEGNIAKKITLLETLGDQTDAEVRAIRKFLTELARKNLDDYKKTHNKEALTFANLYISYIDKLEIFNKEKLAGSVSRKQPQNLIIENRPGTGIEQEASKSNLPLFNAQIIPGQPRKKPKKEKKKVTFGFAQLGSDYPIPAKKHDGGKIQEKKRHSDFRGKVSGQWEQHYHVMNKIDRFLNAKGADIGFSVNLSQQQVKTCLYVIKQELAFWLSEKNNPRKENSNRASTPEENIIYLRELQEKLENKLESKTKSYISQDQILMDYLLERGIQGALVTCETRQTGTFFNSEETFLKFTFKNQAQKNQVAGILGVNGTHFRLGQGENWFSLPSLDTKEILRVVMRVDGANFNHHFAEINTFYNIALEKVSEAKKVISESDPRLPKVMEIERSIEQNNRDFIVLKNNLERFNFEEIMRIINNILDKFKGCTRQLQQLFPVKMVPLENAPDDKIEKAAAKQFDTSQRKSTKPR